MASDFDGHAAVRRHTIRATPGRGSSLEEYVPSYPNCDITNTGEEKWNFRANIYQDEEFAEYVEELETAYDHTSKMIGCVETIEDVLVIFLEHLERDSEDMDVDKAYSQLLHSHRATIRVKGIFQDTLKQVEESLRHTRLRDEEEIERITVRKRRREA